MDDVPAKPKIGRPTLYSAAMAAEIIERYLTKSLPAICQEEGMPGFSTVMEWQVKHPEFAEAIARAREIKADAYFEEAMDIADDAKNDERIADGRRTLNKEFVARSRLRVETRFRAAALLNRSKYGDKQQVELSGAVDMRNKTSDELAAALVGALTAIAKRDEPEE